MSTTCIPPARHIRTDDIPEEYRDIVDAIGMEAFVHLTLLCGGQTLYVPKRESLERGARDRDICALFNGSNYRSLAAQFRLSERQIRKIINGSRCCRTNHEPLGQVSRETCPSDENIFLAICKKNFFFPFFSTYAILRF